MMFATIYNHEYDLSHKFLSKDEATNFISQRPDDGYGINSYYSN